MEFIYDTHLTIPLYQIGLLLLLSTMALIFGRVKLGLLINYVFTLYWGYFLNRDILLGSMAHGEYYTWIYFGGGILIALLALLGFLTHHGN